MMAGGETIAQVLARIKASYPVDKTPEQALTRVFFDQPDDGYNNWKIAGRRGRNDYAKLANSKYRKEFRKVFPNAKKVFDELDKEFSMIPDDEPFLATGILSAYGTNERKYPENLPKEEHSYRVHLDYTLKSLEVKARKEQFLNKGTPKDIQDAYTAIRKAMRKKKIAADLKERLKALLKENSLFVVFSGLHKLYIDFDTRPAIDADIYGQVVMDVLEFIKS